MILTLWAMALAGDDFDPREIAGDKLAMMLCTSQVDESKRMGDHEGVVAAWEKCQADFEAKGLSGEAAWASAMLAVAKMERDFAEVKESDPLKYSHIVLWTVARYPTVAWPDELVQFHWRRIMADTQSRKWLLNVRNVAVRWLGTGELTEEQAADLAAQVDRYIGEAGFTARSDYGRADEADIFVMMKASTSEGQKVTAGSFGSLHTGQITLEASSVKFKSRGDKRAGPVSATGSAEGLDLQTATDEAIEPAAAAFAAVFLREVVNEVFVHYRP